MLIQPHLSLRDTTKIKGIEKGVYNYYSTLDFASTNQYYKLLYKKVITQYIADSSIYDMQIMHCSDEWIFVDYCHFTNEANKYIAREICNYILSNATYHPFETVAK